MVRAYDEARSVLLFAPASHARVLTVRFCVDAACALAGATGEPLLWDGWAAQGRGMWIPNNSSFLTTPPLDVSFLTSNPALKSQTRADEANKNKENAQKLQRIVEVLNENKDLVRLFNPSEQADATLSDIDNLTREIDYFALDAQGRLVICGAV